MMRFALLLGLIALTLSAASAADVPQTTVAAHSMGNGVCWGPFHHPTDLSRGMFGARVVKFRPDGGADIIAKIGDEAQMHPWNGIGAMPAGYFTVGETTEVIAVGEQLTRMTVQWGGRPFELRLAPNGAIDSYHVEVFDARRNLVASDPMQCFHE